MTNGSERRLRFQTDFPPEEFRARRMRLMEKMSYGVALLQGAPQVPGFDAFRQYNEFYYLCGIEVPHAYLLIDAAQRKSALYLPARNERHERGEGPILCFDDVAQVRQWTAVDEVRPIETIIDDIREQSLFCLLHAPSESARACRDTLLAMQKSVDADPLNARPSPESHFRNRIQQIAPAAKIRDLSPLLDELRLIKSPAQIAVMRRAGHLSAIAVREAMRATRAGVMEYQLGAIADYLYLHNNARGGGYRAIIAGGPNAWMGHYYRNDSPLRDGDLVLMDYAPDVNNYTSDIGRMWPVNGTYSPCQRELYGFVVKYHKAVLARIRPGVTPEQVMAEAAAEMRPVIDSTRFSKAIYETAARKMLDFQGHLSHPVGMAVHDVGNYFSKPLAVGTTFAVDPQMWVPEEELYIRCEDTVAVTPTGIENFTREAPLELDEVESTLREKSPFPTIQ